MTGKAISHYRIPKTLAEGKMRVVRQAEDTKLHRHVTLKATHARLDSGKVRGYQ